MNKVDMISEVKNDSNNFITDKFNALLKKFRDKVGNNKDVLDLFVSQNLESVEAIAYFFSYFIKYMTILSRI